MNRQQLEKLNRDCIYEVYEDKEETNEFYMGYIKAIFEKYIIIENYHRSGQFDGFAIIANENIFKIQKGTKYLEPYKNVKSPQIQMPELSSKGDTIYNFLQWAKENKKIVELTTVWDELIIGEIDVLDDELLSMNVLFSDDFSPDGQCFIEYESILDVCVDTLKLQFMEESC
ncbi:hypothetical protein ACY2A2_000962 [Listeria innocua]